METCSGCDPPLFHSSWIGSSSPKTSKGIQRVQEKDEWTIDVKFLFLIFTTLKYI